MLLKTETSIIEAAKTAKSVWDWSREECFGRCEREYYYKYDLGLEANEASTDSLEFGSLLHKHIETNDEKVWDGYKEVGKSKYDYRTAKKGRELVKLYQDTYLATNKDRYEVVGAEIALGWLEDGILIKGKLDELVIDKLDNTLWLREYKTTGMRVGEEYFAPFYLGGQPSLYLWLVGKYMPDIQIGGVIAHLFKVTKKETDHLDLATKVIEACDLQPWTSPADFPILQTMHDLNTEKVWRKKPSQCRRYNRLCEYYSLCRHGQNEATLSQFTIKDENDWHR